MFVKYYFTKMLASGKISSVLICIRAHVYKNGRVRVVRDDESIEIFSDYVYDNINTFIISAIDRGLMLYAIKIVEE